MKAIPRLLPRLLLALVATTTAGLPLPSAHASPARVGNGDDGADLEHLSPLKSGSIMQARDRALALVRKLNVSGISGLGFLEPEIERSPLFLSSEDLPANLEQDQGVFHSSMQGKVFARTLSEPHAATRFYPAAKSLHADQLASLHIHEALHRALPEEVRQNEAAVSALTLAITTPGTTHDSVAAVAERWIPEAETEADEEPETEKPAAKMATELNSSAGATLAQDARVRQPSLFSYEYRRYNPAENGISTVSLRGAHVLRSDLYPFGSEQSTIGIGIEGSVVQGSSKTWMGPLGISGRMRLWSGRGFDVGAWGMVALNVLSASELKNSPLGRDATSAGLSIRKDLRFLTIENRIGVTLPDKAKQEVGAVTYNHEFGSIVLASISAAARLGALRIGGFAELNLADNYRVSGGAFDFESGRYRLLSGGPRISYETLDFVASLSGNLLIDATQNANFDYLGNLLGQGSGQGSWVASLGVYF